jgi:transcriptional regulator with XRE-family HTH domain
MAEELTPSEVFAASMKAQRRGRGWTQHQLADRLGELGYPVHQTTIGKWETGGRRGITLDDALAISNALDVQLVHMLAGSYLRGRDIRVKIARDERTALHPEQMRRWLGGTEKLPWQNGKRFFMEHMGEEEVAARLGAARDEAAATLVQGLLEDEERTEQENEGGE